MEIKNIKKNELEMMCLDLITQSLMELNQKDDDAENKVMLSQSLAKDLINRYSFMPFIAVKIAFYNGIRDTDLFMLSPSNWCKWLNKMKKDIWNGWYNFQNKNFHVIPKEIKTIMQKQPEQIEYHQKKRLINN